MFCWCLRHFSFSWEGSLLSRGKGPLDELGWLALGLAIIVTVALLGGHLAVRAGQPAVLGELLAGVVLGNLPGLGRLEFIGVDPYLAILSQVGMLLLLFEVGLDLSVPGLFAVGPSSLFVALLGTVSSLAIGTGTAALFMPTAPMVTDVFLGAAITATSVGITARVLMDMRASRSDEAKIILGAAVVDDVLALVVLGAVTAWVGAAPGAGSLPHNVDPRARYEDAQASSFSPSSSACGSRRLGSAVRHNCGPAVRCSPSVSVFASFYRGRRARSGWPPSLVRLPQVSCWRIGIQRSSCNAGERPLGELLQPMTSFLVPVFFVLVGFRTNLSALGRPALLVFALALSLAAVVGKLSCTIGVLKSGVRRFTVAVGMIPRGEVTLVFAALGRALLIGQTPLLDERGYTAIVTVVIVTTLVTPPALKWSMKARPGSHGVTRPAA